MCARADVVDAAAAPRVAAQKTPAGEGGAADQAALAQRVDRVLRAARVVLARVRRREQPERPAPRVDQADADVPHAAAFASTSSTRARSHSEPRDSTAPGRPGRAIRT